MSITGDGPFRKGGVLDHRDGRDYRDRYVNRDLYVGRNLILQAGAVLQRPAQDYIFSPTGFRAGSTSGWSIQSVDALVAATLGASESGSTLICPISPLKAGSYITGMRYNGKVTSSGNSVSHNALLMKGVGITATQVASFPSPSTTIVTASFSRSITFDPVQYSIGEMPFIKIIGTTNAVTLLEIYSVTLTVLEQ